MPLSKNSIQNPQNIIWPIAYAGGVLGLFLSWMVLTGDEQGRVNLFYLLLVYLLIPVLSVTLSILSLIFGKGLNLARLLMSFPLWSVSVKSLLRKNQQLKIDKYWLLMQSQAAAIVFSMASLGTFFILLVATDLNFVWRSTILEPRDVIPLLEFVALPWLFWDSAQPTLALIEMTQDSRLVASNIGNQNNGAWWTFILATQLCYSLLLRIILLVATNYWLSKVVKSDIASTLLSEINQHKPTAIVKITVGSVTHNLPKNIVWLNWDNIPTNVWSLLEDNSQLTRTENSVVSNQDTVQDTEQLVILKAWEAPLGELEDYLKQGCGYLQPLDWDNSGLQKLQLKDLQEWQRFIDNLPRWSLYVPEEYMPEVGAL